MLQKRPKPLLGNKVRTAARILLVAESFLFFSSFGVWYKLNTDRDFRLYCKKSCPSVLDGYYRLGEFLDKSDQCRIDDHIVWIREKKI